MLPDAVKHQGALPLRLFEALPPGWVAVPANPSLDRPSWERREPPFLASVRPSVETGGRFVADLVGITSEGVYDGKGVIEEITLLGLSDIFSRIDAVMNRKLDKIEALKKAASEICYRVLADFVCPEAQGLPSQQETGKQLLFVLNGEGVTSFCNRHAIARENAVQVLGAYLAIQNDVEFARRFILDRSPFGSGVEKEAPPPAAEAPLAEDKGGLESIPNAPSQGARLRAASWLMRRGESPPLQDLVELKETLASHGFDFLQWYVEDYEFRETRDLPSGTVTRTEKIHVVEKGIPDSQTPQRHVLPLPVVTYPVAIPDPETLAGEGVRAASVSPPAEDPVSPAEEGPTGPPLPEDALSPEERAYALLQPTERALMRELRTEGVDAFCKKRGLSPEMSADVARAVAIFEDALLPPKADPMPDPDPAPRPGEKLEFCRRIGGRRILYLVSPSGVHSRREARVPILQTVCLAAVFDIALDRIEDAPRFLPSPEKLPSLESVETYTALGALRDVFLAHKAFEKGYFRKGDDARAYHGVLSSDIRGYLNSEPYLLALHVLVSRLFTGTVPENNLAWLAEHRIKGTIDSQIALHEQKIEQWGDGKGFSDTWRILKTALADLRSHPEVVAIPTLGAAAGSPKAHSWIGYRDRAPDPTVPKPALPLVKMSELPEEQQAALRSFFWIADGRRLSFQLDSDGHPLQNRVVPSAEDGRISTLLRIAVERISHPARFLPESIDLCPVPGLHREAYTLLGALRDAYRSATIAPPGELPLLNRSQLLSDHPLRQIYRSPRYGILLQAVSSQLQGIPFDIAEVAPEILRLGRDTLPSYIDALESTVESLAKQRSSVALVTSLNALVSEILDEHRDGEEPRYPATLASLPEGEKAAPPQIEMVKGLTLFDQGLLREYFWLTDDGTSRFQLDEDGYPLIARFPLPKDGRLSSLLDTIAERIRHPARFLFEPAPLGAPGAPAVNGTLSREAYTLLGAVRSVLDPDGVRRFGLAIANARRHETTPSFLHHLRRSPRYAILLQAVVHRLEGVAFEISEVAESLMRAKDHGDLPSKASLLEIAIERLTKPAERKALVEHIQRLADDLRDVPGTEYPLTLPEGNKAPDTSGILQALQALPASETSALTASPALIDASTPAPKAYRCACCHTEGVKLVLCESTPADPPRCLPCFGTLCSIGSERVNEAWYPALPLEASFAPGASLAWQSRAASRGSALIDWWNRLPTYYPIPGQHLTYGYVRWELTDGGMTRTLYVSHRSVHVDYPASNVETSVRGVLNLIVDKISDPIRRLPVPEPLDNHPVLGPGQREAYTLVGAIRAAVLGATRKRRARWSQETLNETLLPKDIAEHFEASDLYVLTLSYLVDRALGHESSIGALSGALTDARALRPDLHGVIHQLIALLSRHLENFDSVNFLRFFDDALAACRELAADIENPLRKAASGSPERRKLPTDAETDDAYRLFFAKDDPMTTSPASSGATGATGAAEPAPAMAEKRDASRVPRPTGTGERTPGFFEGVKDQAQDEGKAMLTRAAGSQFVKLTREPLIALLSRHLAPGDDSMRAKLAAFFKTEIGEVMVASILSLGLLAVPRGNGQMSAVAARLSRELRERAGGQSIDLLADVVMQPLREVMSLYLAGVPSLPEDALPPAPPRELPEGSPRQHVSFDGPAPAYEAGEPTSGRERGS